MKQKYGCAESGEKIGLYGSDVERYYSESDQCLGQGETGAAGQAFTAYKVGYCMGPEITNTENSIMFYANGMQPIMLTYQTPDCTGPAITTQLTEQCTDNDDGETTSWNYDGSYIPTGEPTTAPTPEPSYHPTWEPTYEPSSKPSPDPTYHPTFEPSYEPTYKPSGEPSYHPTFEPSYTPTFMPTKTRTPTHVPDTDKPSRAPITQEPTKTRTPTNWNKAPIVNNGDYASEAAPRAPPKKSGKKMI